MCHGFSYKPLFTSCVFNFSSFIVLSSQLENIVDDTMSERGAIVTGAASGFGLALTKNLLSKGWNVVMADINPAGEAISKDLGENVLWVETNTADWGSQANMFDKGMIISSLGLLNA